jgi:hypothetical protein
VDFDADEYGNVYPNSANFPFRSLERAIASLFKDATASG